PGRNPGGDGAIWAHLFAGSPRNIGILLWALPLDLHLTSPPSRTCLAMNQVLGQREIDPAAVEIHAHQPDADAVAQPEAPARALPHPLVLRGVEVEVVAAELGHVHQPLYVDLVEGHKHAERGDAARAALEHLADAVLHVPALEPGGDVARSFVGAALGHGA